MPARGLQVKLLGGDTLITRVRRNILAYFLSDEASTHLIFIDADIGFEPEKVFRLMDFHAEVTTAIYPIKCIDWKKIASCSDAKRTPLAISGPVLLDRV